MSTMDHDETANRLPSSDYPAVFNGNAYMIAPTTTDAPDAPLIWGVDDWIFMDTGEDTLSTGSFSGPASEVHRPYVPCSPRTPSDTFEGRRDGRRAPVPRT